MKVVIRSSSLWFSFLGIILNAPLAKVRRKLMRKSEPKPQAASEPLADPTIPPDTDQSKPGVR